MKKLVAAFALALFPLLVPAQERALRAGTLSVEFPQEWNFRASAQRAEGHGPEGELVLVNFRVLHPGAPAEVVAQHWTVLRNFARDEMPGLAAGKDTQVIRAVTESPLQDARVEFSSVSKRLREGRDAYFLQYLLGSRRTIAYFTVEGFGDALQAAARFEKILATQRWQE
ncbi:hypothetical protein [Ramlibacter alkalitolerans]|jgi:hypothetical protein|uniref:DUF1795 domain-containing protein n=1 Tax=Ramlibacter alkalitolerans TaxID=2039631 RepID=A0ABS1JH76_9BURK|nr:hypothetical protein [Ramlibacter alkalitolerans]MBL0423573.1 hypothetical protein [Ramlibacter alkalitolerans]